MLLNRSEYFGCNATAMVGAIYEKLGEPVYTAEQADGCAMQQHYPMAQPFADCEKRNTLWRGDCGES